ncbi:MAG: TraR/DksA family transcriptional regulator [Kiritimatiellia bacterium]
MKKTPAKAETQKPTAKSKPKAPAPDKTKPEKAGGFTRAELEEFSKTMKEMRKRMLHQVNELRQQSLLRHDEVNQDEDGTDAFERATSLARASVDQGEIVKINTALMAIKEGVYGLCENCGCKIERTRLAALPFAKTCIKCQSEMEDQGARRRSSTHDLWD